MFLLRWALIFAIVIKKSAKGSSIAEEINFGVSDMRESTENDPQVYIMESQPGQMYADETDDFDASPSEIVETRVSLEETESEDIAGQVKRPRRRRRRRRRKRPKPAVNTENVETYYKLPEEEIKRKPIKIRPENVGELEPMNSNEPTRRRSIKRRRRPIKRPVTEDYVIISEANLDNSNNSEELQLEHQSHDQIASDVYKKLESEGRTDFSLIKIPKEEIEHQKLQSDLNHHAPEVNGVAYESPPLKNDLPSKGSSSLTISDTGHHPLNESMSKHEEVEFPQVHSSLPDVRKSENLYLSSDARRNENQYEPTLSEEQITNAKIRKRPFQKENAKLESKPKIVTSESKNQIKNTRKVDFKPNADENTNKTVHRTKNDDHFKNNATKKEAFKLRRLPPISAILQQAKMRPKNESFLKPPFKVETSKIRQNIGNEILTHVAVNEVQRPVQNETKKEKEKSEEMSTPIIHSRNSQKTVTENEGNEVNNDSNSFEFPIITYTEQRQKPSSTSEANIEQKYSTTSGSRVEHKQKFSTHMSTVLVGQKPISTTTTISLTAENAAFIYVPCNQTITEMLKSSSNGTIENITISTNKKIMNTRSNTGLLNYGLVRSLNKTTHNETANILDAVAVKELERLLQSEMESMVLTSTEKDTNRSLGINEKIAIPLFPDGDVSLIEPKLEYLFQKKVTDIPKFTKDSQDPKFWTDFNIRQPKRIQESSKYKPEPKDDVTSVSKMNSDLGYNKDIILSYTSTSSSNPFNEIDPQELLHENELSLHLRNNSFYRRLTPDNVIHKSKNHNERKKLPLAVKSAIIISGAILALAVLGFFALLLSCKIRHAKSRMKCHRELYREQFQNSEFRQSSRSTSPVVSKSNYNGRNFSNNIQSNVASNRNYYLWQTLRKTFQYD